MGVFGIGSAVTALSPSLGPLVLGRVLQGLGGGALVPLSLALAADLYPSAQRGLAVGAVAALQEAGSVVGPVYGAGLAAVLGGGRAGFWLNLPIRAPNPPGPWASTRAARAAPGHLSPPGR